MGPVAAERDIRLTLRLDPAPALVADADLLSRAVENLVSNAIKYSPAGTEVTIGAAREREAIHRVTDQGYGIPGKPTSCACLKSSTACPRGPGRRRPRHGPGPGAGARNCGVAWRDGNHHQPNQCGIDFTLRIPLENVTRPNST